LSANLKVRPSAVHKAGVERERITTLPFPFSLHKERENPWFTARSTTRYQDGQDEKRGGRKTAHAKTACEQLDERKKKLRRVVGWPHTVSLSVGRGATWGVATGDVSPLLLGLLPSLRRIWAASSLDAGSPMTPKLPHLHTHTQTTGPKHRMCV
jgi:hypothetical protein